MTASGGIVEPHSPGSQFADGLTPDAAPPLDADLLLSGAPQPFGPAEHVLFKPRWGAFHRTALESHLIALDVDTVVVAGCNFPNCPRATIIGASERDFRVLAVSDALSRWTTTAAAELAGIGVAAGTTSTVVESLTQNGKPCA